MTLTDLMLKLKNDKQITDGQYQHYLELAGSAEDGATEKATRLLTLNIESK